jgi:PKD domain-containing protein
MTRLSRRATRVLNPALVLGAACLAPASVALGAALPARVEGRFTMRAVITTAVDVRGEYRGQRLNRTWRIRPSGCRLDVCTVLHLRRTRGHGRSLQITLRRGRDGDYVGDGVFFATLSCRGRIYRHGARVPYTIRLRVTGTRTVGGIRFARRIAATYVNRRRIDRTPCLFGVSHDAARYRGRLRSPLPTPPRPEISVTRGGAGRVSFAATARPGRGPGRRIVTWRWNFGDPAAGSADGADGPFATHAFAASGSYTVTLVAIDRAGLRATTARTVLVPGPAAGAVGSAP